MPMAQQTACPGQQAPPPFAFGVQVPFPTRDPPPAVAIDIADASPVADDAQVETMRNELNFWKKILGECGSHSTEASITMKELAEQNIKSCKINITKTKDLPAQREVLARLFIAKQEKLGKSVAVVDRLQTELAAAMEVARVLQIETEDAQRQLQEVESKLALGSAHGPSPSPGAQIQSQQQGAAILQLQSFAATHMTQEQCQGFQNLLRLAVTGIAAPPMSGPTAGSHVQSADPCPPLPKTKDASMEPVGHEPARGRSRSRANSPESVSSAEGLPNLVGPTITVPPKEPVFTAAEGGVPSG